MTINIEPLMLARFPVLARPSARFLRKPVVDLVRKLIAERRINHTLDLLAGHHGFGFIERLLELLRFRYVAAPTERENIPVEGRVVIVANHPLGALDALALLDLVGSVRRDVRILANDLLLHLEPLRPLLLPVAVLGAGGRQGLREAFRALEREQAVIVFPAGQVSRLRGGGVRDDRWSTGFLRLAAKTGAPVLPVHIAAHNSATFYGVSLLARPLSALLLPRQVFGSGGRATFNIGELIPEPALAVPGLTSERVASRLRRHVYRLPRRKPSGFPTAGAIAHPTPVPAVKAALARGERLGRTSDGKTIILLDAEPDCPAVREIGRLRELSFRRVGEGTGGRRDLDRYDGWYRHIVLWDAEAMQIAGAYRLAEGGTVLRERGLAGLYSHSLFDYQPAAEAFVRQGIELGRSFVTPAYWGSRSLDYLWQGIGAYLRHRPDLRYLFGPVSLSASLPATARDWLVHYHRHFYAAVGDLARARNPYRVDPAVAAPALAAWQGRDAATALPILKAELSRLSTSIPVLYRQYVDLVESGGEGVRFLDFGVDPGFGNCVDGLIRVDLACLRDAKRQRYLAPPRSR